MKKLYTFIFITTFLILCASVCLNQAYAADTDKPTDISITFSNDSLTQKNFSWITKSSSIHETIVKVWEEKGEVLTFNGTSEKVQGYLEYSSDKTKFYADKNTTQFVNHKVTATGLTPGTKYLYQCGDGDENNWSDVGSFTTGEANGDFAFVYMTDSQAFSNNDFALWKRTSEHAVQQYPDAKFAALAGDLVDRGCSENLWDHFFQYGSALTMNYTVVPAIGNHETDTGPHTFDKHFDFPANTNKDLPDYVYSFDYANVHMMVLSTEMSYGQLNSQDQAIKSKAEALLDNQIQWLRDEVKNSQKKWNIVMLHKGLYSSGNYYNSGDALIFRSKLAPVFDELDVDAVLQGHNHTFDEAFLYNGKTVGELNSQSTEVTKTVGTLYLTNNSAGPKFYNVTENVSFPYLIKYAQPKKQMYTGVTVTDNKLRFDTYTVSDNPVDELYDTFTIYK